MNLIIMTCFTKLNIPSVLSGSELAFGTAVSTPCRHRATHYMLVSKRFHKNIYL